MQTVSVLIAGKTYTIQRKPIKANREWRQRFEEPINKLLNAAKAFGDLSSKEFEKPQDLVKSIGAMILLHADSIVKVLLESIDLISDAVFAYSPELQADKDFIEANGYDEEIVNAFMEIVKIAFPFSQVFQTMTRLGQLAEATSQNSSSPSMESGKTK